MSIRGYDAVVVGSGPNGLSGALTLARAGLSVLVLEAQPTIGGGTRTAELTLPGFRHDVCSAVHPFGIGSPVFQSFGLDIDWIHPEVPLAHPLDDGSAAVLARGFEETAATVRGDGRAWARLFRPMAAAWQEATAAPTRLWRHVPALAQFGLGALTPVQWLARGCFKGPHARALLAGISAHACVPLDWPGSSSVGLFLGTLGHAVGWPFPRGGSQAIADALVAALRAAGGEVRVDSPLQSLDEVADVPVVLLDLTPRQLVAVAGRQLPESYLGRLRGYRYGPGVFKLDLALDAPVPWRAADCARAGTLHLGGTLEEMADSEAACWEGRHHPRPYVLVAQQSRFDPTRAPEGKHVLWAYCHVPHGSTRDMTEAILAQIERFAPGFRSLVMASSGMDTADMERWNANHVGGDIAGGANMLRQLLFRPLPKLVPYATPRPGLYLCSSSTPPGPGVHGVCGFMAAWLALRWLRRRS